MTQSFASAPSSLRLRFGKLDGKQELHELSGTHELRGQPVKLSMAGVHYVHLQTGARGDAPVRVTAKRQGKDLWLHQDDAEGGAPLAVLQGYYDQPAPVSLTGQLAGSAPLGYAPDAQGVAFAQLSDGASSSYSLSSLGSETLAGSQELGWRDLAAGVLPLMGLMVPGSGAMPVPVVAAPPPPASPPAPAPAGYQVKTQVFLGEVREGIRVLLFDKDGKLLGQTTDVVKEGDGYVAVVTITNGYRGAMIAMAIDDNDVNGVAAGNYIDETTGTLVDIQLDAPMRSVVTDIETRQTEGGVVNVVISALTELATRLSGVPIPTTPSAVKDGETPTIQALNEQTLRTVAVAEQSLAQFLGINAQGTPLSQLIPDVTTDGLKDSASAAAKYGLALAALSGADTMVIAADQALGQTTTNATDRTLNTLVAGLNFDATTGTLAFKADTAVGEAARASLVNGAIAYETASKPDGQANPSGALQLIVTSDNFRSDSFESSLQVGSMTGDDGVTDVFGSVGLKPDGTPALQTVFVVIEELADNGQTVKTYKFGPIAVAADGSFERSGLELTAGTNFRMFATGRADDSQISQIGEAVSPVVLFVTEPDALPLYLPLTSALVPASGSAEQQAGDPVQPVKPTVQGEGVAGAVVEVQFPSGEVVKVTVQPLLDADGKALTYDDGQPRGTWSATATTVQPHGASEIIVQERRGENLSRTVVPLTLDLQGPAAPTLGDVVQNADGTLTVQGRAEPGAKLVLAWPDGSTSTVTAAADGSFALSSSGLQQAGVIRVASTDSFGNAGTGLELSYRDSTAPQPPALALTVNPNGTLTADGKGEPGAGISIRWPDGSQTQGVVAADGSYALTSAAPQSHGSVVAVLTDPSGNASAPAQAVYVDQTAPLAPSLQASVSPDGRLTVTGLAEPGSVITVSFPDGGEGTATANAQGQYSVTSAAPQTSGVVSVHATDAAGNAGAAAQLSYVDTTAPLAPVLQAGPDGTVPSANPSVIANPDGTLTVTGLAEPGSVVTVLFADGSEGKATANAQGAFSVSSLAPQTSGAISAQATDAAGNQGLATTLNFVDLNAPLAASLNTQANPDGTLTATGLAEPGSTVTVTWPDGSTSTAVAGADGQYAASSATPQTSGSVSVVVTDAAGNASAPAVQTYSDTAAPLAPTLASSANPNGTVTVAGSGEPGSTVTITWPDGTSSSAVVGIDGQYSVTSSTPQTSGAISAVLTDAAGNTGAQAVISYVDSTAPLAPTLTTVANPDGTVSVAGTAEPGSSVTVVFPDGSSVIATANANGNYGASSDMPQTSGTISVAATDAAGNTGPATSQAYADTTAPLAPVVIATPNPNGTLTVSGTAEPGTTITVTFPDGSTGSVVANAQGQYSVTSATVQTSGAVQVLATDAAGNAGAATGLSYTDGSAPLAPTLSTLANPNGTLTVSGTAEPGSVVHVIFPDGSPGTATVGANGSYSVTSNTPQTSGSVSAAVTDAAGNTGAASSLNYIDSTAPLAASLASTANPNGSLTITGSAEPGSTVTITWPDGSTSVATADANGQYSATSATPQTSGTVTAVVTDAAGNSSPAATLSYTDSTAPLAASLAAATNPNGTLTVMGSAEPGSTVTVTYPDGSTGTVVANANGQYSVSSSTPQTSGTVSALVTDAAGNAGAQASISFVDASAPLAPTLDPVANPNGSLTVIGTAEPGAVITVSFPDGSTGTATAAADGHYSVTSTMPQTSGTVSAVVTDAAGNTGPAASLTYSDASAPLAPTLGTTVNPDGSLTVSGTAEPGATVTITWPDGNTSTAIAAANGDYVSTSSLPQSSGMIAVAARDAAGNAGPMAQASYTDSTAPLAPTLQASVNPDGTLTISGSAERGAQVAVSFPDGSIVTVTASLSGSYSATSAAPQTTGVVQAQALDSAGNAGPTAQISYTDSTAPLAPTLVATPNPDGTITAVGAAERGATVTVVFPDGSSGSAVAEASGQFSVTSVTPQTTGTVVASVLDAAGNGGANSAATASFAYVDTSAPLAATLQTQVNPDGTLTVSGSAERGATVTISWPDGSTSIGVADASGAYTIGSPTPQGTGTISAVVSDAAGNVSAPTSASYTDVTAPLVATVQAAPNPDGSLTVSGQAERGAAVTVSFPDGSSRTVTTDANGQYSATSAVPQTSGVVLAVVTDANGNAAAAASLNYVDSTAPLAPTLATTVNPDGTLTISGSAERGATVTVTYPDGSIGTATADANGQYSLTSAAPQTSGTVSAAVTDAAGNVGATTSSAYADSTAPLAPTLTTTVNPNGTLTITGTAEPGATVTVSYPDGSTVNAVAAADGQYSATSAMPQTSGAVSASARDLAGNGGAVTQAAYIDSTAPLAPTLTTTVNPNGRLTVSGSAEPGSTVTVTYPDGSTGTVIAAANGSYSITSPAPQTSGTVSALATDAAGNPGAAASLAYVDSTAPLAPALNTTVNPNGTLTVSGTGEPGSTVTVSYPDGSTGSTTIAANGSYSISSATPQTSGTVSAVVTDAAGNVGVASSSAYVDSTAPLAPTLATAVNPNGTLTVSGTAEPGSTVTVSYPDGSTGTATAAADGSYSLTSTTPQTSGTVSASARDLAGNSGAATTSAYTDISAPLAPTLATTVNPNGTLTVSGMAEPGSTVTVTYPDGTTGTATAAANGSYSVTSPAPQTSGTVSASARDLAGNSGAVTSSAYSDSTAPLAPTLVTTVNSNGSLTISGMAEPGSTVTVTYPDGTSGTATAAANGSYSVTSPAPQTSGTVSASARDLAGNSGAVTSVVYTDSTTPLAPTLSTTVNPDGTLTISGTAEPGSTVTVTYPDGTTGTITATANGGYSITSPTPQTTGTVHAAATDVAGNVGATTSSAYADSTAPLAPTLSTTVNPNGTLTISGTAEPGSTVTVTYPDGTTGSATAAANGSYSVTSPAPQTTGTVHVAATDAAGNVGATTTAAYTDNTAPLAPTLTTSVNPNGTLTITGTAEPGSTVTVTYPDGTTSTATAATNGSYSVTSPAPQTSGTVQAAATDAAGNVGATTTSAYSDNTAPLAPTLTTTVNPNGTLTITGTAEPGSTVTVTYPDGTSSTAIAAANGSFSVTSPAPQTTGTVQAAATDAAGNVGATTTSAYADSTAPLAPTLATTVNPNGTLTITGTAEPGSTVTVTYPDGTTGTATAAANGSYSVTSPAPQTTGTVQAVATDAAGNLGAATTAAYTDSTAPLAPTLSTTVNPNGTLTITGSAEPGSTVTVTYPDGTTSTATAAANGSYSVTSVGPQTTGTVQAAATDAAGNLGATTTSAYTDSTAPLAPTAAITVNSDGTLTIAGTAEPHAAVIVVFQDGAPVIVVAAANGSYSATSTTPQTTSSITITATDVAGNTGPVTTLSYTDSTAPLAPTFTATPLPDGTLMVAGSAEPGTVVTITFPDGSTQQTLAGYNGQFAGYSMSPQTSGTVQVVAQDTAGNASPVTTASYTDSTAPLFPTLNTAANPNGTLTVTGLAEAGTTVTVSFNDGSTGTAVAQADGTYSITSAAPQTTGSLSVVATDLAGNASPTTVDLYIDSTAPLTPTLLTSPNANGTLTVSGTGERGATVTVSFPDGSTGTAVVNASGNYTVTSAAPQTSGVVSATATDLAGNISPQASLGYTDISAPLAPTLTATANANGTLTLSGTAERGAQVTVTFPDGSQGTVTANGSGAFSLTSPTPQTTGAIAARATDAAGNQGAATTSTYTDITAPLAPTLATTVNANGTLTITGTAEPGATVTVTFPNGNTGTATAAANGSYSITSAAVQTTGSIAVRATDAAGNQGAAATASYTDTTAPLAPTLTSAANANGTLTVSGTAEAGATVTVSFPDGSTGTTTAAANGSYSVTSSAPQTSGNVSVSARDAANNAGPATAASYVDTTAPLAPSAAITVNSNGTLTIAGLAEPGATVTVVFLDGPAATVTAAANGSYSVTSATPQTTSTITVAATDVAGNAGAATSLSYTDSTAPLVPTVNAAAQPDGTLLVTGTAEPGSIVVVTFPDGTTETTLAAYNGQYLALSAMPQTSGTVQARATDTAGNAGPIGTRSYTDNTAPLAPTLSTSVNANGTLTATGTGEPGATITINWPDSGTSTTTVDSLGNYSVTSSAPQTSGTTLARATDAAGNISPQVSLSYVDTTAPLAPTISLSPNPNGTLSVSGSAEPGALVTVTFPDATTTQVTANAVGAYLATSAVPITTGTVTVVSSDQAGNLGASATANYVDTFAPLAPTLGATANANGTLTVTGTAERGSTVVITYPDGSTSSVTAAANGSFTATSPSPQTSGTVQARATDAAGNISPVATVSFTDNLAPIAPAVPVVTDDVAGGIVGTIAAAGVTNDAQPTFSGPAGSAEAGTTITLLDGGTVIGATVVGSNGAWSWTPSSAMSNASHTITARLTDTAGNVSTLSSGITFTVDTVAPTAPASAPASYSDNVGSIVSTTSTAATSDDNTPSINIGALPAGVASAVLYVDGAVVASTYDSANGRLTPTTPLTDGAHTLAYAYGDTAGNISAASPTRSVTIDTVAPTTPASAPSYTDNVGGITSTTSTADTSDDTTPGLNIGALPAGATSATLFVDGAQVAATYDSGTGTLTPNTALTTGAHTLTYALSDAAGNTSGQSPARSITIDTTAPAVTTTISNLTDNASGSNVTVNAGGVSSDTTPTVNGTISASLGAGDAVNVYRDGTYVGQATVSGTSWNYTDSNVTQGSHTYTARVVDSAGNLATVSSGFTFTESLPTFAVSNLSQSTYAKFLNIEFPVLAFNNSLIYAPGTTNFGSKLSVGGTASGFVTGIAAGDDDAFGTVSLTSTFGATGLNVMGTNYTSAYIGTNGYITFKAGKTDYTPSGIPGYTGLATTGPMFAAMYTDLFTGTSKGQQASPGGNSSPTGTPGGLYAFADTAHNSMTFTWDDVGWYNMTNGVAGDSYVYGNAFQIRMTQITGGQIVLEYIYENVSWADGNSGGAFTAGWAKGDGVLYGNMPGSGTASVLNLETASNVGINGVFRWIIDGEGNLTSGTVPMIDIRATGSAQLAAQLTGTSINGSSATTWALQAGSDSRFSLVNGSQIQANAGTVFDPSETSVTLNVIQTDPANGVQYVKPVTIQLFDSFVLGYSTTVSSLTDDVLLNTGAGLNGSTTNDTAPVINGVISQTLSAGWSVHVFRDGTDLGTANVSGTSWSYQDTDVTDGSHIYTARVVAPGGTRATVSSDFTITFNNGTNDTYQAANTSFVEFNGGAGTDTLEFTAAGTFNASSFSNKVTDTEVIHLGTGNQALTIGSADVLAMAATGQSISITTSGSGDTIHFTEGVGTGASSWHNVGTTSGVTDYRYFDATNTATNLHLLVNTAVSVI